jgi:hypothetical protein
MEDYATLFELGQRAFPRITISESFKRAKAANTERYQEAVRKAELRMDQLRKQASRR